MKDKIDYSKFRAFWKSVLYSDYFTNETNAKKDGNWSFGLLRSGCYRIQHTIDYLNMRHVSKKNLAGEAFDFYEIVECISIILECSVGIYSCFREDPKTFLGTKRSFIRSNTSKASDYEFFKFVRSAVIAHPVDTTRHQLVTRVPGEFYPSAFWSTSYIDGSRRPERYVVLTTDYDDNQIENFFNEEKNEKLASSFPQTSKTYCLFLNEFFDFAQEIVDSFSTLLAIAETKFGCD
jgi:hypothetical protein